MAELTTSWRKSSYSVDNVNTNNCVEVGTVSGAILVRDTTSRAGATLSVSPSAWSTFTSTLT
jgi:hypothetical protein